MGRVRVRFVGREMNAAPVVQVVCRGGQTEFRRCLRALELDPDAMRLWTVHPRYLDARGLVALWREGLLARRVLEGRTRGYRQHPQLERFRAHADPLSAVDAYLWGIHDESCTRGYCFDSTKLGPRRDITIEETRGQLDHEWTHLRAKLRVRSSRAYDVALHTVSPEPHPVFRIVDGPVRAWERGSTNRAGDDTTAAPGG